ncbi:hypothetical protein [Actinoplanes sp. HUAS TT8]|uniref:hypothetical protein n=1 Tax=Actinoplanes sp. HUAS TT8 TaxID=3447453 RepID=UPI003F5268BD
MPALIPLAIVALMTIAPVVAFLIIAAMSLKDTKPAERPKILKELSAMIAWRSRQQVSSPQQVTSQRRRRRPQPPNN